MLTNKPYLLLVALFFWTTCLPVKSYSFEPTDEDLLLLHKIQQDTFKYFVRMSDKVTGLTRDSSQTGSPASVAATGFSLVAFTLAHEHGWIDRDYAYDYLRKTLRALHRKVEHKKGFYYHFVDPRSGKRVWGSEASSIDTALLIAGALYAGQSFPNTEIQKLAEDIYERVDWTWLLNQDSLLISMGWTPEGGTLPYYWDTYNELLILQALALGSPTHPIPEEAWHAWLRNADVYNEKEIIYAHSGSLFTYQYSHAFIDFRNLNDRGINYYENSINASIANWEFSYSFSDSYESYSESSWGLSASVGPGGYKAYGALPGEAIHDGTIAPYASISSIIFTPEESVMAVRFMYNNLREHLYGNFGFKGAYNLDKDWFAHEYLGIDQGVIILMLENYLNNGAIWEKFMQVPAIYQWIRVCGLSQ